MKRTDSQVRYPVISLGLLFHWWDGYNNEFKCSSMQFHILSPSLLVTVMYLLEPQGIYLILGDPPVDSCGVPPVNILLRYFNTMIISPSDRIYCNTGPISTFFMVSVTKGSWSTTPVHSCCLMLNK